ncbi:MAG: DUF1214 domain-containing protein [Acidimicrobiales bacterium]|nr:DUF1214 domain-containing protein [Hyphomonadaceae bacterium]RZV42240.1 MAG: DUF1214 domain-containing protein [Acidimicrobiales bacterium]
MTDDTAQSIWRKFCRDLEAAGDSVLSSDLAASPLDEAEAVRYLTRLTRVGLDMFLENADPAFPSFYQASHATAKIGSDNPDNFYQNATISGDYSYLIKGNRGTVPILSFGTKANRYAVDGTMASTGELDIRDVKCKPDGSFEITVSREKQGDNWLPLEGDTSMLIVRQTFFDRSKETPATVDITAINAGATPDPLTHKKLSAGLQSVPAFVGGTATIFKHWAELFRAENHNALNTVNQAMFSNAGGDPMIFYLHGWWQLADDEALRIHTEIPDCEGWNFQINNVWMESLDYRHHPIHTNNELADLNDDGSVTVIVSKTRPKSGNWIDTASHTHGTMLWRWTGADDHPVPKVEVIKNHV